MKDPQKEKAREKRLQGVFMKRDKRTRRYRTFWDFLAAENEKRDARELLKKATEVRS